MANFDGESKGEKDDEQASPTSGTDVHSPGSFGIASLFYPRAG
jgi:hypothetical protein